MSTKYCPGYGMTEASGAFCNADNMAAEDKLRGSKRKYGTVGVPMYNVQMKVKQLQTALDHFLIS